MISRPSERTRDNYRKRAERAENKNVRIRDCEDRDRREELEADDVAWLRWYFGEQSGCDNPFWYPFTSQQLEMISALRMAIEYGGDQSIAASRGEGKTTICERLLLKYTLSGVVKFPVLFSATAKSATNSLDTIKMAVVDNEFLHADYPDICDPVAALESTPQRAKTQTGSGRYHGDRRRTYDKAELCYSWCGSEVMFPNTPGSPAAGALIATRGLDSAVRGLKMFGVRPDVAVIDDPDTADTARSEEQADKLRDKIDADIGGLGDQQRAVARVLLTTLQSRVSVSYALTDETVSQLWKPKRFRYLVKPPDREDLWEEYITMMKQDALDGDGFCRRSHNFYIANRELMELGAVVANEHRYDDRKLPDGSQLEVSALQRYYNTIARTSKEAVATEFDNDPPEETGPVESSLKPTRIMRQLSGYPRCIVPSDTACLVQGIDVGKTAMHWVVRAWRPGCVGYTVAHGVQDVVGTTVGSEDGLDVCIRRAIITRFEEMRDEYSTPDGEVVPIDLTLVDARYRTDAVYAACRDIGVSIRPAMGHGKSQGCVRATFSEFQHTIRTVSTKVKPGDGISWYEKHASGLWVVHFFADRWKNWEQDRWLTDPGTAGCLFNYGEPNNDSRMSDDEMHHLSYAHHVCNEKEVEELQKDGTTKRKWKVRGQNHWLDASAMSDVAAAKMGISLLGGSSGNTKQATQQRRKSLAEMAAG
jgi:hypothetical protein